MFASTVAVFWNSIEYTVDSEMFARIFFYQIALKDISDRGDKVQD